MAELFEQRVWDLVRNFKHLYGGTSSKRRDKRLLQDSREEEGLTQSCPLVEIHENSNQKQCYYHFNEIYSMAQKQL